MMNCSVLRSKQKDFTYVYLLDGHDFDDLPISLKNAFGEPEFVMSLALNEDRKLAYEDVNEVMKNLQEQGFHLQLPPKEDETGLLQLPERQETLL